MVNHNYIQLILFGFFIIKESSTNPIQNETLCSPSLPARNEQFPHVVFVKTRRNGEILCRGTLIDVNWVLTSAQCVNNDNGIPLDNIELAMGNKTREIIRKPKTVVVEKKNDAALIEMDKPVVITNTLAPIGLAAATEDLSKNTKCVVSSFQKYSNEDLSLIYWNVMNISKQTSNKSEWYFKDEICHGKVTMSLQKTTDNGIPLICNNHLYGILYSFDKPRVFNNILNYEKWIQNVIKTATSDKRSNNAKTFVLDSWSSSDTNIVDTTPDDMDMDYSSDQSSAISEYTMTYPTQPSSPPTETSTSTPFPTTEHDTESTVITKTSPSPGQRDYSSTTTIGSSTIEESTSSPILSTTTTGETKKMTDRERITDSPITTSPFAGTSTDITGGTGEILETEGEIFTVLSGSDTSSTPFLTTVTQSSTTEKLTPERLTNTPEETEETEDVPHQSTSVADTTVFEYTEETPGTEDVTPIHIDTPPTATTTTSTTTTTSASVTPTITSTSTKATITSTSATPTTIITTTAHTDITKQPSNATTQSVGTTSGTTDTTTVGSDAPEYTTNSTQVTYDIHDPTETTTFVYDHTEESSSQIISFSTTLIIFLCCILYYTNL